MDYLALRSDFNSLAFCLFDSCYLVRAPDRASLIHKLSGLAWEVLTTAEGRDDADKVASEIVGILRRAYSMPSALNKCQVLRDAFARERVEA